MIGGGRRRREQEGWELGGHPNPEGPRQTPSPADPPWRDPKTLELCSHTPCLLEPFFPKGIGLSWLPPALTPV